MIFRLKLQPIRDILITYGIVAKKVPPKVSPPTAVVLVEPKPEISNVSQSITAVEEIHKPENGFFFLIIIYDARFQLTVVAPPS